MGTLVYGSAPAIDIEDRTLRHLQAVMIAKLRRHENFAFNWDQEPGVGTDTTSDDGAHGTILVSEAVQLYFRYDGPRQSQLNRVWLNELMVAANTSYGLRAVPEPARDDATTDQAAFV
jgi:hypothetical protein